MAGSLNKVMLIGNLGADPEVRQFQNGGKVCNLRIAARLKPGRIATPENAARKLNGIRCPCSRKVWCACVSNTCARDRRSLSKASCKRASGRINPAMTAIRPRLFCKATDPTLTMLDGRGEGGGQRGYGGGQGGDYGGGSQGGYGGGDSGPAPAGGGFDDEIPF